VKEVSHAEPVELYDLLERRPTQLSGGQRQRVAIGARDDPHAARCSCSTSRCPTSTPSCASHMRAQIARLHSGN
jgi:ABC-type sugar transport system ATPase subunit